MSADMLRNANRVHESCGGWISVEDRLPEPLEDVIVCRGVGMTEEPEVRMGYMFFDGSWIFDRSTDDPVTHWMPMPEPPAPPKTKED